MGISAYMAQEKMRSGYTKQNVIHFSICMAFV